jgi:hypothetical protein
MTASTIGTKKTVILLDTNVTMLEEFEGQEEENYIGMTKFDVAKYVALEMVLSASPKQQVVAVILLKTARTHHHFYRSKEDMAQVDAVIAASSNCGPSSNDADNDEIFFPNVTEWTAENDNLRQNIQNLMITNTPDRERKLSELFHTENDNAHTAETSSMKGDFLNGLVVGADTMYRALTRNGTETKETEAKILLLTDGRHKVDVDQKQLLVSMDSMRKLNCCFDVIFFGSNEESEEDRHDENESDSENEDSESKEDDVSSDNDDDDDDDSESDDEEDENLDNIQSQNDALLRRLSNKLNGNFLVPRSVKDALSNLLSRQDVPADRTDQVISEAVATKNNPWEPEKPDTDKFTLSVASKQNVSRISLSGQKRPRRESSLHLNNGWIRWDGSDDVSLDEWLHMVRPSCYSGNRDVPYATLPYCAWIYVENVNSKSLGFGMDEEKDFNLVRYMAPLNEISRIIRSGSRVPSSAKERCIAEIMRMAKEDNRTVGKWLIYVQKEDADSIWDRIARATAHGKLGCGSKISPVGYIQQPTTVICVYVKDSTDKQEVQRVLKVLRDDMGITESLRSFKPDIFTYLDLYSTNPWRLKPTLYGWKEALAWDFGEAH